MKSTRLAFLLAVAAVAYAGTATAQMPEMPLGKWWKRPRVVEALKITPEQQDKLEAIFSKNRRNFVDLRADVERRSIDLDELLSKKDSDPKKVASASDALEQAKSRLGKARTMMVYEMKTVLTDDQWQRILERRDEWRRELARERADRWEQGRGRRGRLGGVPPMKEPQGGDAPKE